MHTTNLRTIMHKEKARRVLKSDRTGWIEDEDGDRYY
jgi:hypothetical protein